MTRRNHRFFIAAAEHEYLSSFVDERGCHSADGEIDGMAEDSFPASDPPSHSGVRLGRPPQPHPPRP
jgi:hypothetical protein